MVPETVEPVAEVENDKKTFCDKYLQERIEKMDGLTTVTNENFSEKWDYVSGKLIESKKKKLIRKVVIGVGNIIFLAYFILIAFGAMYRVDYAPWIAYLNKTPVLPAMWKSVESLFLHPELHWAAQTLIYIVPAYVITVPVCLLLAVLIWNVYRPNLQVVKTEDISVNSKELYKMSIGANACIGKQPVGTSFLCNVIFVFTFALLASGFLVEIITVGNEEAILLITQVFFVNQNIRVGLALLLVCAYSLVNLILGHMLKPMYVTKFDASVVEAAETFYHECNPNLKAQAEAEDAILAQAKEIQKRRQEEKEELENAYRPKPNPTWGKIKLGLKIVSILACIGMGIWFYNKVDFGQYLDFSQVDFNVSGYLDDSESVEDTEETETTEVTE